MAPIIIYISGFGQHAGKTMTSIGLLSTLKKYFKPEELGYIKPVGQEIFQLSNGDFIDKDVSIIQQFAEIPDFDLKNVSPVRLGPGVTRKYLDSADKKIAAAVIEKRLTDAFLTLNHKKVIVAEGTGHPGVGGIVGLSNAQVCRLIGAEIVYLSGGGIGKALDIFEVNMAYFHHRKCKVRGVLFNKLIPEKIDMMKEYITEDLINRQFNYFGEPLKVLGYMPQIDFLYKPSLKVISKKFPNVVKIGDDKSSRWKEPCLARKLVTLSLKYLDPEVYFTNGDCILIGSTSSARLASIIEYDKKLKSVGKNAKGLGGIILTCGKSVPLKQDNINKIIKAGIPAIYVQEDSASSEMIVSDCFNSTKLQIFDDEKIERIVSLFNNHFEIEKFIKAFSLKII